MNTKEYKVRPAASHPSMIHRLRASQAVIQLKARDLDTILFIDLNDFFGRSGCEYTVGVDRSGVVEADSRTVRGVLFLSACEGGCVGAKACVAIRATAPDGSYAVQTLNVELVRHTARAQAA